MHCLSENELLLLFNRRDDKAFKYLYNLYFVALKNVALHYVQNEEEAEDLVQEVFIELFKSIGTFSNVNEIRYFLYGVLKNKCFSSLRKNKVRRNYIETVLKEKEEQYSYEAFVLEEDVYVRLMSALDKLPPRCKLVMELSLKGLNRTEISEKLNISIETVKEHRALGKKRLIELLKDVYYLYLFFFI